MKFDLSHIALVTALPLSFFLALVLIGVFRWMKIKDFSLSLGRAMHDRPTPRLGGVAVILSIFIALSLLEVAFNWMILLACVPIFAIGVMEDLSFETRPSLRLGIGALTALGFVWGRQVWLPGVDVPGLDYLFTFDVFAIAFTVFAITGLSNAINLIDGINGLASGKVLLSSAAVVYLATIYGEVNIQILALAIFVATLGLFMLNFPNGHIFMGDAGAYTLGFLLGICLVTLKFKNPEISAWAILLIVFWPVADTVHSMIRRRSKRKSANRPDKMHMHHVIMRSLEIRSKGSLKRKQSNPLATAIILPMASVPVICACIFVEDTSVLVGITLFFAFAFTVLFRWLVQRYGNVRQANGAS